MINYPLLNLPPVNLNLKKEGDTVFVFDANRKKWLVLTPEEWVRQHFLNYLIIHKNYPSSLISIESGLAYNKLKKRSDILVYNQLGNPLLIVECKAAHCKLNQAAVNQVGAYNKTINATYLCVTNGLKNICWTFDKKAEKFQFLEDLPAWINK
jgi:hypothetical protein